MMKEIQLTAEGERPTGQPWAIVFVYAPDESVVVKGATGAVRRYLDRHYPKAVYRWTIWKNGKHGGHWGSTISRYGENAGNVSVYIWRERNEEKDRDMWCVTFSGPNGREKLWFRRMPNRWIDLYDDVLEFVGRQ